MPIIYGM